MASLFDGPGRFLSELKRRKVYRVAVAYLAVVFVGLQAVSLLVPATTLPLWADELLTALAVFGFPVALVLAWAYEMTPRGIRRAPPSRPDDRSSPERADIGSGRRRRILVGIVLLGVLGAGGYALLETDDGSPAGLSKMRSVAVLPFDNLSEEPGLEPFVRGIHADLTSQLSMVGALRVISRHSAERYRGTERALPEIARELGASWVLEGGVQSTGDRVRVTARLLNAEADAHVWAARYDRRLTVENVFRIQADLARRIAAAMEAEISPEEEGRLGRPPTQDIEAYNLYRMGRHLADRRTTGSLERAAGYFREAIARDSAYAEAYVGIADVYSQLGSWGITSRQEAFRTAREAAQRALSLDDHLGSAWASLGFIHFWYEWDWDAAERAFLRAIELNPSYSTAHHWHSLVLASLGRFDEAETAIGRAFELDPLSRIIRTIEARLHWLQGDCERAAAGHRRALELDPAYAVGHMWLALAYECQGRMEDAREHFRRAATLDPHGAVPLAGLAHAHAVAGEREEALELLRELERRGGGESPVPFWSAVVHVDLGQIDRAFEELDLAFRTRDGWLTELAVTPLLSPLRSDPRYRALARRLGLDAAAAPPSVGGRPDGVDPRFGDRPLAIPALPVAQGVLHGVSGFVSGWQRWGTQ